MTMTQEQYEMGRNDLSNTLMEAIRLAGDRATRAGDRQDFNHKVYSALYKMRAIIEGYHRRAGTDENEFLRSVTLTRPGSSGIPQYLKAGSGVLRAQEKWFSFITKTLQRRAPVGWASGAIDSLLTEGVIQAMSEILGEVSRDRVYQVEVLGGSDITRIYAEQQFGSCMWGGSTNGCARQVGWYDAISDQGQLNIVALRNEDGSLAARALLWHAERSGTGEPVTLLDRIYPSSGEGASHVRFLKRWAQENGVAEYKASQSTGNSYAGRYVVRNLPIWQGFPYMDTFAYGTRQEDGRVSVSNVYDGTSVALQNTRGSNPFPWVEGDPEREPQVTCDCCGDDYDEEEMHTVRSPRRTSFQVCESCFDEDYRSADGERGWAEDEYFHTDHLTRTIDDTYILNDNAEELDIDFYGHYQEAHRDDTVEDYAGRTILRSDASPLADYRFYHDNDSDVYEVDGEYHPESEVVLLYDGEEYGLRKNAVELTAGKYQGEYALADSTVTDRDGDVILRSESITLCDGTVILNGTELLFSVQNIGRATLHFTPELFAQRHRALSSAVIEARNLGASSEFIEALEARTEVPA